LEEAEAMFPFYDLCLLCKERNKDEEKKPDKSSPNFKRKIIENINESLDDWIEHASSEKKKTGGTKEREDLEASVVEGGSALTKKLRKVIATTESENIDYLLSLHQMLGKLHLADEAALVKNRLAEIEREITSR
jgi:hypothetical protein